MGKIIAVVNQKGGVGKTTTCVNLSAALHEQGKRVLLCDFDPQANSTSGLGVSKNTQPNAYHLIIGQAQIREVIVSTPYGDLLPSSKVLSGAAVELVAMENREFKLKEALEQVRDDYDYIYIDCPPSLELLTLNGLCAADGVLIPVQCEYYALEGVSDLVGTLKTVKHNFSSALAVDGVLLTMYVARTNLCEQVAKDVRWFFGDKVYKTVIPRSIRLGEAPSHGQPVITYDKHCRASKSYRELAKEIVSRETGGKR